MTFPFMRASGFDTVARHFNPSTANESFYGPVWRPPGWATSFQLSDVDPLHSVNYIHDAGRSFICPSRSHGGDYLTESFDAGLTNGWSLDGCSGTGQALIDNISGGDPAINGNALDLHTGATAGGTAAVYRTLGAPVPSSFGFMCVPRLMYATTADEAQHIWVQNNAGSTLMTRRFLGASETFVGGAWRRLADHGLTSFWEDWTLAVDMGDGTHDVRLYLGTKLWNSYRGVLPTNQLANNRLIILQKSNAGSNYRRSQLAQINVGWQLPDDMIICSYIVTVPDSLPSPTCGHVKLHFENVSADITPANLKAFVTKDDCATWQEIPLCDYGEWGKGVIDNNFAPALIFAGSGPFAAGTGRSVRVCVKSFGGCLPVLQGLTVFWE